MMQRGAWIMMLGFLVASCSPPREKAEGVSYPSAIEAAFAAQRVVFGNGEIVDRAGTLALLAKPQRQQAIDLDADGTPEVIWSIGEYALPGGYVSTMDGATGNQAWCIIAGPRYRVIAARFGWMPHLMESRTRGWLDFFSGSSLGGGSRGVTLFRSNGSQYAPAGGLTVGGSESDSLLSGTLAPPNRQMIRLIEARVGHTLPPEDGIAFQLDEFGDEWFVSTRTQGEDEDLFIVLREQGVWHIDGAMRLGKDNSSVLTPEYEEAEKAWYFRLSPGKWEPPMRVRANPGQ